jgi:DNA-binding MurR/RpiR family transcriptional regulator
MLHKLTSQETIETIIETDGDRWMTAPPATVQDAISENYDGLSAALRAAADYVARHPLDVATRSLRTVASDASMSPATLSRLARQLGFEGYEALREASRAEIGQQAGLLSRKARELQASHDARTADFLDTQTQACLTNLSTLTRFVPRDAIEAAVQALEDARRVIVLGGRSSAGLADYLCYMANWLSPDWRRADIPSASIGQALVDVAPGDVVLVIVKAPFTPRSLKAAELASKAGATVMAITDSHACPTLGHAEHRFILPSDSPQFFPSYAATVVFLEALIGILVARGGDRVQTRIGKLEEQNHALDHLG